MRYSGWIDALRTTGKGKVDLKPIDRGEAYYDSFNAVGDITGDSIEVDFFTDPGAVGLVSASVDLSTFEEFDEGRTTITISLTAMQTAFASLVDADGDGVEEVLFNIFYTPSGGTRERIANGSTKIVDV